MLGLILIVFRFSQDMQLVDKQLPSALQTVVVRRSHVSPIKLAKYIDTLRNLQASHADNTSLRG